MPDLILAPINVSGAGTRTVIAGEAGKIIQVVGMYFQCNIATTLTIKTGTTAQTGAMSFTGSGGLNLPIQSNGLVYFQCADGDDFVFYFSGITGQAAGQIFYYQFSA
jgi:hypothetical protein